MKKQFIFFVVAFFFLSITSIINTKTFASGEIKWNNYEKIPFSEYVKTLSSLNE